MKQSERMKWIKKCEKLIRENKFKLFGKRCQFCGKKAGLGLFHVLSVGSHPRLRLHEDNLLIAGWYCCHYKWHHDPFFARDIMFPKLVKLLGKRWEEDLWELERTMPKLNLIRIKEIHEELEALND